MSSGQPPTNDTCADAQLIGDGSTPGEITGLTSDTIYCPVDEIG